MLSLTFIFPLALSICSVKVTKMRLKNSHSVLRLCIDFLNDGLQEIILDVYVQNLRSSSVLLECNMLSDT